MSRVLNRGLSIGSHAVYVLTQCGRRLGFPYLVRCPCPKGTGDGRTGALVFPSGHDEWHSGGAVIFWARPHRSRRAWPVDVLRDAYRLLKGSRGTSPCTALSPQPRRVSSTSECVRTPRGAPGPSLGGLLQSPWVVRLVDVVSRPETVPFVRRSRPDDDSHPGPGPSRSPREGGTADVDSGSRASRGRPYGVETHTCNSTRGVVRVP